MNTEAACQNITGQHGCNDRPARDIMRRLLLQLHSISLVNTLQWQLMQFAKGRGSKVRAASVQPAFSPLADKDKAFDQNCQYNKKDRRSDNRQHTRPSFFTVLCIEKVCFAGFCFFAVISATFPSHSGIEKLYSSALLNPWRHKKTLRSSGTRPSFFAGAYTGQ